MTPFSSGLRSSKCPRNTFIIKTQGLYENDFYYNLNEIHNALVVRRTPTERAMDSIPDNNVVSDINQIMEEVLAQCSASMTKQLGKITSWS